MARTLEEAYKDLEAFHAAGDTEAAAAVARYIQQQEAAQKPTFKETAKNVAGFVADSVRSGAKGAANTFNTYLDISPLMAPTRWVTDALAKQQGTSRQEMIEKIRPTPENETPEERRWRSVMEGAGAAQVFPGGFVAKTLTGAMGGLGADMGAQAGAKFAPDMESAPLVGSVMGGMLLGGATGFLTGPKQTLAQKELREAQKGMTAADYKAMEEKLARAKASGADTYMLVDTQPENAPLQVLTSKYGSMETHNPLRDNLAKRPADLQKLGETTVSRAAGTGKPVSPANVMQRLEDAATGAVNNLDEIRSKAILNRLKGKTVSQQDFDAVETALETWGQGQPRTSTQEAVRQVLEQLRSPDGKPILELPQLSLAIKELKRQAPGVEAATGQKILSKDLRDAIKIAEGELAKVSKDYRESMADFREFSQRVLGPVKQGPIGVVADKRPFVDDPAPIGGLNRVISGQTPDTVSGVGRVLNTPQFTQQQNINPREIAAAIIQQRLERGSTDPGRTVRGLPGSRAEENLSALIRSGGGDATRALAPLQVADEMQSLTKLGLKGPPEMHWWQYGIRPLRSLDMATTQQGEVRAAAEIAKIMASKDPKMIRQLQEIAMFDPNVRRLLSTVLPAQVGYQQEQ